MVEKEALLLKKKEPTKNFGFYFKKATLKSTKKKINEPKILYSPGIGIISIFSYQISIFCQEENEHF